MKIGLVLDPYGAPGGGSPGAFVPMIQALISDATRSFICYVRAEKVEAAKGIYADAQVRSLGSGPVSLLGSRSLDPSLDAYLFTTPVIPLFFKPRRAYVIVQDLAYLDVPSRSLRERLAAPLLRLLYGRSLRLADRVIAISEATKESVIRHFSIPAEKIEVVHIGYRAPSMTPKEFAAPERFFLFAGALKERKNVARIIEAFAKAHAASPDLHLLIAGRTIGPYHGYLRNLVRSLGVTDSVRFIGFVSDDELSYLYRKTIAFVFPSLIEGFGMPIVEAFAADAAVITSNTGACAEVAGDAALLVDPEDTGQIAAAMVRIASDDVLRHELIKKGRERAAAFSWESAATALRSLLVYTP